MCSSLLSVPSRARDRKGEERREERGRREREGREGERKIKSREQSSDGEGGAVMVREEQ